MQAVRLSTRRILLIVMSIIGIIIVALLAIGSGSNNDGYIFGFLGLFMLGVLQFLSSIFNFVRGSKLQGGYLLLSIIFLLFYVAGISGYIDFPGAETEEGAIAWLFWPPLLMACLYTLILFFDPASKADRGKAPLADTLDDGEWLD